MGQMNRNWETEKIWGVRSVEVVHYGDWRDKFPETLRSRKRILTSRRTKEEAENFAMGWENPNTIGPDYRLPEVDIVNWLFVIVRGL